MIAAFISQEREREREREPHCPHRPRGVAGATQVNHVITQFEQERLGLNYTPAG